MVLNREDDASRHRLLKAENADIGDIPPIMDPERRESCRLDFRNFLVTYKPDRYVLEFSPYHEELIGAVETAILSSLRKLIVFPRGSGKTSISRDAVEWGTLYGHIRFPMLFGAELKKTKQHMQSILTDLLYNEMLLEDFPEVCYPINQSEGISNRARFQRYRGEHTRLRIGAEHLVFPEIDLSRERGNGGSIIAVGTITGSASRGPLINNLRPDFALIDDPQTRSSAKSPMQCRERMDAINGDIAGMAGPTKQLSMLMTATVITHGDAIDQMLDKEEYPHWDG